MRRRGRKAKQSEESVDIYRVNPDTDVMEEMFTDIMMIIKPSTSISDTDLGFTVELNNRYIAFITPPMDDINSGDEFRRSVNNATNPEQKLIVLKEDQGISTQRVFLEDIDKQFS